MTSLGRAQYGLEYNPNVIFFIVKFAPTTIGDTSLEI